MATATFDWTSQDFLSDPYVHYRSLRENSPVHLDESLGIYLLTRYEDVIAVLRDHELYSAERRALMRGVPGAQMMLTTDPPEHTRLRTLVNKAFTPRTIEQRRPRIQDIADRLLNDVAADGRMDVIADFPRLQLASETVHWRPAPSLRGLSALPVLL